MSLLPILRHEFIRVDVFYNKKQLPLGQALKERGWDAKEIEEKCNLVETNKEKFLKCSSGFYGELRFHFGYKQLHYSISWGSRLIDDSEDYLKGLQVVAPEIQLPEHIYSAEHLSDKDIERIIELGNKVIEKIVSTFRILDE